MLRYALITAALLTAGPLSPPTAYGENGEVPPLPKHKLIFTEVGGGSDSSVSPDGTYLAFSTRRSGNLDVWVADVETGEARQITHNPATDNEPRWHPDGNQLVFVTMRNGSQDVYRVDLETGEETPVATQPYNEDYPSFSKDGTEVCYTGGPRGYREVMVYNIAADEHRTLTRGYGYVGSTNFSPDGSHVVFHAYYDNSYLSGRADVFTVSSQKGGGRPVNVTKDADIWDYKPNWSWDGNWITFSSKRGTPNFNIWLMRPDGSDLRAITHVEGPVPYTSSGEVSMSNANVLDQRWSNWTKDGRIGWHQINPQRGLLRAADAATGAVRDVFTSEFGINDLALSPGGDRLLFENDGRIFTLGTKLGAEPVAIASGVSPRWSSDGGHVSFLSRWGTRVGVVAAEGGEERTIGVQPAQWPAQAASPLSPDGTKLALITGEAGARNLVVVDQSGDTTTLVEKANALTAPVWSADGARLFFGQNIPASVSYFITEEPIVEMGG